MRQFYDHKNECMRFSMQQTHVHTHTGKHTGTCAHIYIHMCACTNTHTHTHTHTHTRAIPTFHFQRTYVYTYRALCTGVLLQGSLGSERINDLYSGFEQISRQTVQLVHFIILPLLPMFTDRKCYHGNCPATWNNFSCLLLPHS